MKKLVWLSVFVLLVAGCGKNKDPQPDSQTADFKVEFSQSGDYTGYYRFVSTDADLVFEGTDTSPLVLESKDLPEAKYTLVTAKKIKSLSVTFLTTFEVAKTPAEFKFRIYRNGKLIDTKTVNITPDNTLPKNYYWDYKAVD